MSNDNRFMCCLSTCHTRHAGEVHQQHAVYIVEAAAPDQCRCRLLQYASKHFNMDCNPNSHVCLIIRQTQHPATAAAAARQDSMSDLPPATCTSAAFTDRFCSCRCPMLNAPVKISNHIHQHTCLLVQFACPVHISCLLVASMSD
jgi:hypothetical protein